MQENAEVYNPEGRIGKNRQLFPQRAARLMQAWSDKATGE